MKEFPHTDELHVFFMPADVSKPCEMRNISRSLSSMKELIGDYIEIVRSSTLLGKASNEANVVMVVAEDGKAKGFPRNVRGEIYYPYSTIVGDVFLCGEGMVDGEVDLVSLPQDFEPNNWIASIPR